MAEKMDSDRSFSGESSSSSSESSTSGSSDGDEDALERVRVLGRNFELPQDLCEDYSLFKEVFSMKTWESLGDKQKEHLKTFLPQFKENNENEKDTTLKMLFNYEPFKFTSPLSDFYNDLKLGNFRPDLAKMRKMLAKARKKQQRQRMREYYAKLLPSLLIARERLLVAARGAPPGPVPSLPRLPPRPILKPGQRSLYQRAKQRYFDELNAVTSEVGGNSSDDQLYPEGPDQHKDGQSESGDLNLEEEPIVYGTLSGFSKPYPNPVLSVKDMLAAHRLRRMQRESHPELNINGITLDDIEERVTSGGKRFLFGGIKTESPVPKLKRGTKRDSISKGKVSEGKTIKKIKEENDVDGTTTLTEVKYENESDSESSSFVDPMTSPKASTSLEQVEIKQEVIDETQTENCYTNSKDRENSQPPPLQTVIKEEPPDVYPPNSGTVHLPMKLEDLDGIDMMALPVQLADEAGEVIQVEASADELQDLQDDKVVEVDESLTETTHANFLSMVRALFPARDAHRASKQQLHARCGAVMKSPIAPLNTWYPLSDDWCAELDSALEFLAGERGTHPLEFVPYLQYISRTQTYQWIGAGRDGDPILDRLCDRWLRSMSPRQEPTSSVRNPPPPKYPTSWTVRPPTGADITEFRVQERRRFTTASKPFTYIQHGYRSVVGPCARAWVSSGCAGTSLLVPDRPRHATFTSLVRDALARLPNGEGTRHDVMTLLKMSQYIAKCSQQALLGAVSAVLERFHTAKRDPVVKFDQRTAVWMYLHRNRSEDDWTRTTSGRSRGAKSAALIYFPPLPSTSPSPASPITANNSTIVQTAPKPSPNSPPPLVRTTTPVKEKASDSMEVDSTSVEEFIEASDSDVDVDDSSVPTSAPQLSSAQLLMQVTLGEARITPTTKPKKPVYTPPQKRPITAKQPSLTKQSKQAALMNQSVKQAKILAEAVKQASATAQNKANLTAARNMAKQAALLTKASSSQGLQGTLQGKPTLKSISKTVKLPSQSPKAPQSPKQQTAVKQMSTSPMQPPTSPMHPPPSPKQMPLSPKPPPSPKQSSSPRPQSPLQPPSPKIPSKLLQSASKPSASAKQPLLPGKQIPGSPKLSSPKQPMSEKQFPPVYLSKEEFSLSGTELPQPTKKPAQIEIKPSQTVFLKPQSPIKHLQSPMTSPQSTMSSPPSPMTPSQSAMPPPQSSVPLSQSSMPPPKSPMPPPKSLMPPPKSPMPPKSPTPSPQSIMPPPQSPVQHSSMHTVKQLSQTRHLSQMGKPLTKAGKQLPLIIKHPESSKPAILTKSVVSTPSSIKTISPQQISKPILSQANATLSRSSSLPTIVATPPHKSALIKQRTSIKTDAIQASLVKANVLPQQISTSQSVIHPVVNPSYHKMAPGTRSLLIRPPSSQSFVSASVTPTTQVTGTRRGMVRVLSPANQSSGKSLISPRALLQDSPTTKKRTTISTTSAITTLAQSSVSGTTVVSSVQTAVPTSVPMRAVQLSGGRTLQLSANQTVHFPGGQAVQLSPGHALQLSSLQLPSLQMQHTTHSVRLPSGQTVPLATPQVMQALKASKNQNLRVQTTPTLKTLQSNQVIPVSTVQLAGQTVQFGNQTVQLAGQSVQLTGHTVKLPSGQSVQIASPNVLPSGVQLAGNTFQLSGGSMQTVQMGGQNVQISNSALGSQTVQLAGQTVQLAGSQTVQLPSGQTLQLPSGQTLQLAGGVQLANQAKAMPHVIRSQSQGEKMNNQPIMAKLLTNAQGQMVSLEGMVGGGRIVSGIRPRPQIRVLSPATRLTRPLLLTSAKPLHNIILQSDGSAVRVTSAGGVSTSQTIVINNMAAQTVTTPATTTPVLKLQQASSATTPPSSSGVRSVVMDGTQLKLVSGRHVLARILRPNHPPPQ